MNGGTAKDRQARMLGEVCGTARIVASATPSDMMSKSAPRECLEYNQMGRHAADEAASAYQLSCCFNVTFIVAIVMN